MPYALSIGVSYGLFWKLNPNTLRPFEAAYRLRTEREIELRSSEIDISAWSIGLYVRAAIVAALDGKAEYPDKPVSLQKKQEEQMTAKDHANNFREFLKHYKRPPVKGGEK